MVETAQFERNKNLKASGITFISCTLLFIVFFLVHWTVPQTPEPIFEEGIEVNLGNSETGLGDIAPMIPGEPSNEQTVTENIPQQQAANTPTQETNITETENDEPDAPVVSKINKAITKPANKTIPTPISKNTKPAETSTPTPPKPKATMAKYNGSNGNGGNNADSYNGVKNQGIAGGNGDQGKPNGNPNSDSYIGNAASGNSGVSIRSGLTGRKITKLPSFEDEFNEPAKVAVDIIVDATGNVTNAIINPKGTTTTNQSIRGIALKKAKQLKLNRGTNEEEKGTIVFNFKLKE
ncbi:MAG: hypothetical protein ACOVNY_09155 [Chitinophagaceae bacterium]